MNDSKQPISAFDEICQLTEQVMRSMELEILISLHRQATQEFHRSALSIRALKKIIAEKTMARDSTHASKPEDRA